MHRQRILPSLLGARRTDSGNGTINYALLQYIMPTNLRNVREPWFVSLTEAVFLGLFFASLVGTVLPARAQTFQSGAPHAILIDAGTRSVLFEKDADALVVPASTVKIMTAEIVFHELALGHLHLDDQFVVSES